MNLAFGGGGTWVVRKDTAGGNINREVFEEGEAAYESNQIPGGNNLVTDDDRQFPDRVKLRCYHV